MKKNRKIFIISWYYIFGSIILTALPVILLIFTFVFDNETLTLSTKIFLYTICPIIFIIFLVISGITFIQWVIMDDEKIIARNLFKTIRVSEWKDIIEVREEKIGFTYLVPKFKWLIFIDSNEGEVYLRSPLNWKGRFTKIKANKKSRIYIAECQNLYNKGKE